MKEGTMTDSATQAPERRLTTLQQSAVRMRAGEIGNKLLSRRITEVSEVDSAVRAASHEVMLASTYIEEALASYVSGFSSAAKEGLSPEMRTRLNIGG